MILLAVLGASLVFVETDSATFVVTVLAIHLVAAMAIISSFFYFD